MPGWVLVMATLIAPTWAQAHGGHVPAGLLSGISFLSGFSHPFSGLDHLLAMLGIGLWTSHISQNSGKKVLWQIPGTFIVMMLLGGVLAASGVSIHWVEGGIVLSLIVLGAILATARHFSPEICAAITGGFALFHGITHGAEMPPEAQGLAFASGFAVSSALLQLAGITLGRFESLSRQRLPSRMAGGLISLTGLVMLLIPS